MTKSKIGQVVSYIVILLVIVAVIGVFAHFTKDVYKRQELLERLLPGLDGKDAEVMKAILKTFGLEGAKK